LRESRFLGSWKKGIAKKGGHEAGGKKKPVGGKEVDAKIKRGT